MYKKLLFSLLLFLISVSPSYALTFSSQNQSEDFTNVCTVDIREQAPDTNYKSETYSDSIRGTFTPYTHVFFKFDYSSLPAVINITNAKLHLVPYEIYGSNPHNLVVRRIINNSSTSCNMTWHKQDGSTDWDGSEGAFTSGTDYSTTLLGSKEDSYVRDEAFTIDLDGDEVENLIGGSEWLYVDSTTYSFGMALKMQTSNAYITFDYTESSPTPTVTLSPTPILPVSLLSSSTSTFKTDALKILSIVFLAVIGLIITIGLLKWGLKSFMHFSGIHQRGLPDLVSQKGEEIDKSEKKNRL